ncbi:MAG: septum formation initiator family protein [Bacteroidales bacterium]|nr:septum formation initiator family protein [Bacteroidales bacterium]MCF8326969.1 septum formation initiator family protein [Bacteroidales bacterium]
MQKYWNKIPSYFRNKYFITVLVFAIYMMFFDQNNMVSQWRLNNKVNELQEEKSYYKEEIKKDRKASMELKTNKKTLERYAREKYLMKRDDEDIFLIIDEDEKD